MKRKKFYLGSVLAVVMMMAFSVSTIAQPRGGMKGSGMGMKGQSMCEKVIPDLTEEQEKQLKELRSDHWETMSEFRSDMRILKAEYHDLIAGDDRNLNEAENKIDEITGLKNKMMKERQNHRESIRDLLDEDQKEAFDRMMQHHRAGMGMGKCCGTGHNFGKGYHKGGHGKKGWHGKPGGCDGDGPRWMDDDD